MVVTNHAKNRIALYIGQSGPPFPTGMMIGNGSGTALATDTTLGSPFDRQTFTQTPTFPASQKIAFQGDWNSIEVSGLSLKEFGIAGSGVGTAGSMWSRASIPGVTFDGTNELRIEETWEIF